MTGVSIEYIALLVLSVGWLTFFYKYFRGSPVQERLFWASIVVASLVVLDGA